MSTSELSITIKNPQIEDLMPEQQVIPENKRLEYKSLNRGPIEGSFETIMKYLNSEEARKDLNSMVNIKEKSGIIHFGIREERKLSAFYVERGIIIDEFQRQKVNDRIAEIFYNFFPSISSRYYKINWIRMSDNGDQQQSRYRFYIKIFKKGSLCFTDFKNKIAYRREETQALRVSNEEIIETYKEKQKNLDYKIRFQANLDAQYAKEMQDLFFMYTKIPEAMSLDDFSVRLKKFYQIFDNQLLKSTYLAVSILNVLNNLSSLTRSGLHVKLIEDAIVITTEIYYIFRNKISEKRRAGNGKCEQINDPLEADTIKAQGQVTEPIEDEIIGNQEDYQDILEIIFETCMNVAHDGVKYRNSKEIFNYGVVPLARIVQDLVKSKPTYEKRYDSLKYSIRNSNLGEEEKENLNACLDLLKKRFSCSTKEEAYQIDDILHFNYNFKVY
jgi:hypothetical protein